MIGLALLSTVVLCQYEASRQIFIHLEEAVRLDTAQVLFCILSKYSPAVAGYRAIIWCTKAVIASKIRTYAHLLCLLSFVMTGGHRAGVCLCQDRRDRPAGGIYFRFAPGQPAERGRQVLHRGPVRCGQDRVPAHSKLGPPGLHARQAAPVPAGCGCRPESQLATHMEGGMCPALKNDTLSQNIN